MQLHDTVVRRVSSSRVRLLGWPAGALVPVEKGVCVGGVKKKKKSQVNFISLFLFMKQALSAMLTAVTRLIECQAVCGQAGIGILVALPGEQELRHPGSQQPKTVVAIIAAAKARSANVGISAQGEADAYAVANGISSYPRGFLHCSDGLASPVIRV